MGGRGASAGSTKVMTEREFLSSKGLGEGFYSDPGMHTPKRWLSQRAKRDMDKLYVKKADEYANKREKAKAEYNNLVKQGKIIKPTREQELAKIAKGTGTQAEAAKRVLEKRRRRMGK